MRDIALQIARESPAVRLHALREYVQNYLLWLMQRDGLNVRLFFVGGTALRFLWRIGRFSEDLDFCAGPDWAPEEFSESARKIEVGLAAAGYDVYLYLREERTVQRAVFRFAGLLAELGLAGRMEQKLSIALEIDSRPPSGWAGAKTVVNVHIPVLIQHYDLPSLLASKAAAALTRKYMKGRDFFDLFWFLSKWPDLEPNPLLLKNALAQSREETGEANWRDLLIRAVRGVRWSRLEEDVRAFIETPDSLLAFTQENLLRLLAQTHGT